uniref:RRM domain-containing protein n=1 Tax=Plectus sambesii TaxID=2011161 RepID=A0A914X7W0_9BILA
MASHGGGHYRGRGGQRGEEREGLSAVDRSQRSVFVGNISYEATEEQIKDVFSAVGPVVHFRLVHDRDTGKPK